MSFGATRRPRISRRFATAWLGAMLLFSSFAFAAPASAVTVVDFRLPWVGGQKWTTNLGPNNTCTNGSPGHCTTDIRNRWAYDFGPPLTGHPRLPVVAAAAGTVTSLVEGSFDDSDCKTTWDRQNYVVIKHADNTYTEYHHLTTVIVSPGNTVKAGQMIGTVGCTGHTRGVTGVHLHFARAVKDAATGVLDIDTLDTIAIDFTESTSATWDKAVNPCSLDASQPAGDWNAVPSGAWCARYYRDRQLDDPKTNGASDATKARYWSVMSRIEPWLEHHFGATNFPESAPYDGVSYLAYAPFWTSSEFGAKYAGRWGMPVGTYRFTATTSDGIRVWIDGAKKLESWPSSRSGAATFSWYTTFASGTSHVIEVEYFNVGGGAVIDLSWESCAHGC